MSPTLTLLSPFALAAIFVSSAAAHPPPHEVPGPVEEARRAEPPLAGPSWQLAAIRYSDDSTVVPDDPTRYTLQFLQDGRVLVRADCNRGTGTWRADGSTLILGPVGMTRAMCPPGSLFDRYATNLEAVVSYVIRDGTLYLAMRVDAGILEFRLAP